MSPAKRAPYDAWEPFLFRSADPGKVFFFLEGIPPAWLLWYRLGGCNLHIYSNKEACTNSRKGSRFVSNRSLTTELKQADATSYRGNLQLNRCYALPIFLINPLFCPYSVSKNMKKIIYAHEMFQEAVVISYFFFLCDQQTKN